MPCFGLLRQYRGFLCLCVALWAAGCAGSPQGLPRGAIEQARFQTADGTAAMIMRAPDADIYYLYVPKTDWPAQHLAVLDGLAGMALVDSAILGQESVLLLRGTEPGCAARYRLMAIHMPTVQSMTFPRCDETFALIPQPGGQSVVIRDATQRPPLSYTYAGGNLTGPVIEARAKRHKPTPAAAHKPAAPAVGPDKPPPPAPSSMGVDLD